MVPTLQKIDNMLKFHEMTKKFGMDAAEERIKNWGENLGMKKR
jgi:hypothetical protein